MSNILCLPYQPRNKLSGSLSAADLHTVVMGDRFKGLVHPCKVYNIVGIGAPLLYIGPEESHISELFQQHANGLNARSARHGAVDDVVAHIQAAAAAGPIRVAGAEEVTSHFSYHTLLPRMISIVEHVGGKADLPAQTTTQAQASR